MDNKSETVFDKLDKQEEKIEDLNEKFKDVSINDLYALAKRTWDYGDYTTAQKYYNHISLLRPLDWKAPFYASWCNFEGEHEVDYFNRSFSKKEDLIIATIKYVDSLELDRDNKSKEMKEFIEIMIDQVLYEFTFYKRYKAKFDQHEKDYVYNLENYYIKLVEALDIYNYSCIQKVSFDISNQLIDVIEYTNKISSDISEEKLVLIESKTNRHCIIDSKKVFGENKNIKNNKLTEEEIINIKLNGIKYFEYNDKILTKRYFKRSLVCGILILAISIVGIVISNLIKWYISIPYYVNLIYGIILIIKAFNQKEMTNCASILLEEPRKNRRDSQGNVVSEKSFSLIKYYNIFTYFTIMASCYLVVLSFININLIFSIVNGIIYALELITTVYVVAKIYSLESTSEFNGKYKYKFYDNYYEFKD